MTGGVLCGGVEAGGTKWVCAIGTGPADVRESVTIPMTTPDETIAAVVRFFAGKPLAAVGVGSFGPIDVRPSSPTWGSITTTPKPGWANTDVVGPLTRALELPVALDTDVNVAALAEQRWGAAVGLDTVCYVTVGTGIGGGGVVNGRLMHGLLHPEIGHMRIPHDRQIDPFDGACPYHGDCFEGLASGVAIRARWGRPGEELEDDAVWRLEAHYLALGLANVVCVLAPERIILGGGVMRQPALLPLVRAGVRELLAGYVDVNELRDGLDGYIVAPALGERAGVLGALELARLSVDGGLRPH
ncbi:MAG: ROK family protein [Actinomycetota bacterium]|nr:ROK family protein [Actinomycetota bacterium]